MLYAVVIGTLLTVVGGGVLGIQDNVLELLVGLLTAVISGLVIALVASRLAQQREAHLQSLAENAAIRQMRREVVHNKQLEVSLEG